MVVPAAVAVVVYPNLMLSSNGVVMVGLIEKTTSPVPVSFAIFAAVTMPSEISAAVSGEKAGG